MASRDATGSGCCVTFLSFDFWSKFLLCCPLQLAKLPASGSWVLRLRVCVSTHPATSRILKWHKARAMKWNGNWWRRGTERRVLFSQGTDKMTGSIQLTSRWCLTWHRKFSVGPMQNYTKEHGWTEERTHFLSLQSDSARTLTGPGLQDPTWPKHKLQRKLFSASCSIIHTYICNQIKNYKIYKEIDHKGEKG